MAATDTTLTAAQLAERNHLRRGILVVLGGFLIHLTLGTVYTFGNVSTYVTSYIRAYVDPEFTYEKATWIYAGNLMATGGFMILGGFLEWKIGPRFTAFLGCMIASVGIFITTFVVSISPGLVIFTYGVMFGTGTGIAYVVPLACGMRWFPARRGLVTGTVLGGFGLGSFIFNQVQTAYVNPHNLAIDKETRFFTDDDLLSRVPSLFMILGSTYAVLQVIGCLLLTNPPPAVKPAETSAVENGAQKGEKDDDNPNNMQMKTLDQTDAEKAALEEKAKEVIGDVSISPRHIFKTKEYYMLWFTFFFNQQAIGYITTMYKAFGQTFIQDDKFLALVGAFAAVLQASGRIAWGALGDKTCYRTAMMIVTSCLAVFMATFIFADRGGKAMFAIWVFLIFFTFCGNYALLPAATCQTFGPTFTGTNYGLVFSCTIISQPIQSLLTQNLTPLIGSTGLLIMMASSTFISFLITVFYDKQPGPKKIRERLGLPAYN